MTLFKIPLRRLLSTTDLETKAVLSVAPGTSAYMQLTFKKHIERSNGIIVVPFF